MASRARSVAALVALSSVAALGTGCRAQAPAASADAEKSNDDGAAARRFDRVEDEVLRDLAAIDQRVASRARVVPSEQDLERVAMAAVLGEDTTVAIVDGRIDPFSFDARGRGLEAARRKLETLPPDRQAGLPSERRLLADLIDSEVVRLDEERALPRSASALVRALVEGWRPPKSQREAAERDRWLTRRLESVRDAMASADASTTALDVVRARDLDDTLDTLEHVVSAPGFTEATQALVRLREAIEAAGARPAATARSEWSSVARRVHAHLGLVLSGDEIARDLAALEPLLRAAAEAALAEASVGKEALIAELDRVLFAPGACVDAIPASRVRSIAAPPEREPSCRLRHLVAAASDGAGRAIALAAMHDHLVVAEWALDVARGASTIANAEDAHHRLLAGPPDSRVRFERIATARPVAAIGAGVTVRILMGGGAGAGADAAARAAKWATLGEVPLDVAAESVGGASIPPSGAAERQRAAAAGARPFEMWASFSSTSMSAMR